MIVLDTNVVAAVMSPSSFAAVEPWWRDVDGAQLYMTSITRAEIRYRIRRLPEGARRDDLSARADAAFAAAGERMLSFDSAAADRYGWVVAERERRGRPITVLDAQIAAICLVRNASLATRNVKDFTGIGLRVIDPFAAGKEPS